MDLSDEPQKDIKVNLSQNLINVRKIDSMTNYNTNNSISIKELNKIEIEENKTIKKNDICVTDGNELINHNLMNKKMLLSNNINELSTNKNNENIVHSLDSNKNKICSLKEGEEIVEGIIIGKYLQ